MSFTFKLIVSVLALFVALVAGNLVYGAVHTESAPERAGVTCMVSTVDGVITADCTEN